MNKKAATAAKPEPTRPQGRPALAVGQSSEFVGIRMTAAQKAKLQRLGGAAWIRDCIDKAHKP